MKTVSYLLVFFLLLSMQTWCFAQVLPVYWSTDHKSPIELPDSLELSNVEDSCHVYLRKLHEQAYLEASVDSIIKTSTHINIKLHLGRPYRWSYLHLDSVPKFIKEGLTYSFAEGHLFHPDDIENLFEEILQKAENLGYPFAAVHLDSIGIVENNIVASVKMKLNQKFTIEQIEIEGNLSISDRYLKHIIAIDEGQPFNKQEIIAIKDRLNSISFLTYKKDPVVDFLGNSATVHLFLDKKNANRFDILLGLQPTGVGDQRRFRLTGNVNIDLANQFGAGEIFHLNYKNLMPATQDLDLSLNYPFIFDWSFGTELNFNLYKRDSSYIDIGYQAGIHYFLNTNDYVQFFVENQSTKLLTIDTNRILRTHQLPEFLDVRQKLLGTTLHFEKLNYRLNPRKGYDITLRLSAGTKNIKKNQTIISIKDPFDTEFNFNDLYENIKLNSFQFRSSVAIHKYLPVFRSSAIKFSMNSGLISSGQKMFDNELFRIGGTKLLRGFNEESIFANFYSILTTEYRLLFNQNSNLFIFWDLGYYEKNTLSGRIIDQPMGFGTGLNLETKVGIFTITYALGKQNENPISFRQGRIHFGMISQF